MAISPIFPEKTIEYIPGKIIILDAIIKAVKRSGWEPKIKIHPRFYGTECHIIYGNQSFVLNHNTKTGYELKYAGTWTRNRVHYLKRRETRHATEKTRHRKPKLRKFITYSIYAEKRKERELVCRDVTDS